jgi:hypothetical protein
MRNRAFCLGLVFLAVGCGVQQITPANRQFVLKLQSSVSSKKADWLEAATKQIDEQKSKGAMSDAEYAAFKPIIEKARAGDWSGAQHDVFALNEGQKPTEDDLAKVRNRKVSKD